MLGHDTERGRGETAFGSGHPESSRWRAGRSPHRGRRRGREIAKLTHSSNGHTAVVTRRDVGPTVGYDHKAEGWVGVLVSGTAGETRIEVEPDGTSRSSASDLSGFINPQHEGARKSPVPGSPDSPRGEAMPTARIEPLRRWRPTHSIRISVLFSRCVPTISDTGPVMRSDLPGRARLLPSRGAGSDGASPHRFERLRLRYALDSCRFFRSASRSFWTDV